MNILIDNGVNQDPTWTETIVFSIDGGASWEFIQKSAISKISIGQPIKRDTKFYKHEYQTSARIYGHNNVLLLDFELQNLDSASPYYATWANGTPASVAQAYSDINSWL